MRYECHNSICGVFGKLAKTIRKQGWIVLDQIRTINKRRMVKKLGTMSNNTIQKMKETIKEMLID